MKRILASVMALILILSSFSFIASASLFGDNTDYLNDNTFENKLFDFTYLTKVDEQSARNYFADLKVNGMSNDDIAYIESLLVNDGNSGYVSYANNIIYAQENYANIISTLTEAEKLILDKYLLNFTLLYYQEFMSPPPMSNLDLPRVDIEPIDPIESGVNSENTPIGGEFIGENSIMPLADPAVCKLSIFCDGSDKTWEDPSGSIELQRGEHAWITVKNISNLSVTIGAFNIAPNKTLSIGTWNSPNPQYNNGGHDGVHYNYEAYKIYRYGHYAPRVSLTLDLTQSEVNDLNYYFLTNPTKDVWGLTNNCTVFASDIWNYFSSNKVSPGLIPLPKNLAPSIASHPSYAIGASVPYDYVPYYRLLFPQVLNLAP